MKDKEKELFFKLLFSQHTKFPLITIVNKGSYKPFFCINDFCFDNLEIYLENTEEIPEVSIIMCNNDCIKKYIKEYKLLGFDVCSILGEDTTVKKFKWETKTYIGGGLRPVLVIK